MNSRLCMSDMFLILALGPAAPTGMAALSVYRTLNLRPNAGSHRAHLNCSESAAIDSRHAFRGQSSVIRNGKIRQATVTANPKGTRRRACGFERIDRAAGGISLSTNVKGRIARWHSTCAVRNTASRSTCCSTCSRPDSRPRSASAWSPAVDRPTLRACGSGKRAGKRSQDVQVTLMRKPSCLISCSHWLPEVAPQLKLEGSRGQNSAGSLQIYATFQTDNLRRHF